MKKVLSAIVACAILVGALFTLVSCGGPLSGTYEGDLFDLKFSGNDVTVSFEKIETTIKGTYEIKEKDDDSKTITFDFIKNEDDKEQTTAFALLDIIMSPDLPFEEDGDTIKIGKIVKFEFTKK